MISPLNTWLDKRKKARAKIHWARKWPFAILLGLGLGAVALVDKGVLAADKGLTSTCQMRVVRTDKLPVRASPDELNSQIVEYLRRDDVRGASTTVEKGYRKLYDGNWARDQYLAPVPPMNRCTPGS